MTGGMEAMAETLHSTAETGVLAGATTPRWYAIYTKARHEKRVDGLLRERGIETYLPLIPRMSQWKDRKKVVEWPLFPSYVFARFALREVYSVLGVAGVAAVVKSNGRPAAVDDGELENVRLFAEAVRCGPAEVHARPFHATGSWVEVTEGPFRGVRGVVEERRGRTRVLIGLKAIGQGLEVDIDVSLLKAVPSP
jgi:transcription antitermination factor NusG